MHDPAGGTILGAPARLLLWVLALVSVTLFLRGVLRYVRVLARARPEPRWDRACPALASGYALSSKALMHQVKDLVRASPAGTPDGARLLGERVKPEEVWACMTCLACIRRCPVSNKHLPVLIELRRRLMAEGVLDGPLQQALQNLARYGNSLGQSARNRARWTVGLEPKIKDARKEPVSWLWFTGDYAAYDPRVQPATRAPPPTTIPATWAATTAFTRRPGGSCGPWA